MPKISEVIKFIRENDIDHEGWTDNELAVGINNAIQGDGFDYVTDDFGNLRGIYMGKWIDQSTFHIFCLVGRNAMKELLKKFKTKHTHPVKFVGDRHVHERGTVGKYSKQLKYREYSF